MKMFKKLLLLFALLLGLSLIAAPAYATLIDPVVVDGNPDCSDIGCVGIDVKFDPPVSGTFSLLGGADLTIAIYSTASGQAFDWTITSGSVDLCAVIAKGGESGANVYFYERVFPYYEGMDVYYGDQGLHAPLNPSDYWANLSHIDFCYNSVPEPATMLLLGTGLMALGLWGWGRKRSKARS
jgi:hypothetical protein